MPRHAVERHNEEFRRLKESSGLTVQEIAAELGVSIGAVQSWLLPTTSKRACACSIERVEQFKDALKKMRKRA